MTWLYSLEADLNVSLWNWWDLNKIIIGVSPNWPLWLSLYWQNWHFYKIK